MPSGPLEPPGTSSPPWWLRIAVKSVLARLPLDSDVWQRVGIFRHGAMDDAGYARGVLDGHRRRAGLSSLAGRTVLELGPGNSVATALLARAYGGRAVLVDAGPFASRDLDLYRSLGRELREEGLDMPDLSKVSTLGELLERCDAVYLTEGLRSLESIESGSVDLILSQAVLEHVRVGEFEDTMRELARVLAPDGVASHRVDLRDHLGGSLNNLRVPSSLWERPWFVRGGFYTNRMSLHEMTACFERTHRIVETTVRTRWASPPVPRRRLAPEFRTRTEEDLRVAGFDVILRHRPVGVGH